MALLNQCSWAATDPTQLVPGQVYSFAVAVPALIATTGLAGTVLDTATAATVGWSITGPSPAPPGLGVPLTLGDDYQIVSGGLNQTNLAFVVNPSRTESFNVQPLLTVAGGATQISSIGQAGWGPITYTPMGQTAADLQPEVENLLQAALQLTTSADIIAPGAAVTLQIIQTALSAAPQIATNIVHELPDVKIRGAIGLGALIEAIIGPLTGAISSALPSSTDSVSGVVGDVANLLADALAIPLAIDVNGRKVTRTLVPLTTDLLTTVTSAPGDAQNLIGTVPIDGFLADFHLSTGVTVNWQISFDNVNFTDVNSSPEVACLSPLVNLVQTLLLLPAIVALESPSPFSPPVYLRAQLQCDLPQLGITGPNAALVTLGPLTLLRLPVVLPQIGAVFTKALDDASDGQLAMLVTDVVGARLLPSLDAVIRLLSTLSSVLDTFSKAAATLGVAANPPVGLWANLLGLGQAVRLLVALLGRIPQSNIYFQPAYQSQTGPDNISTFETCVDVGDNFAQFLPARAAIHIGVPAVYTDPKTFQSTGKWFRIAAISDVGSVSLPFLDFNNPNFIFSYFSIVKDLKGEFDKFTYPYPPFTADTDPDPGLDVTKFHNYWLEFRTGDPRQKTP